MGRKHKDAASKKIRKQTETSAAVDPPASDLTPPSAAVAPSKDDPFKPYACPECEYKANKKWILANHVKNRHNKQDRPFACPLCDYRAVRKDHISLHLVSAKHANHADNVQLMAQRDASHLHIAPHGGRRFAAKGGDVKKREPRCKSCKKSESDCRASTCGKFDYVDSDLDEA
eukprot:m.199363 g.199363  ORF g.199363 m.199363 type:complete len:173 (+) comp20734_c0_seq1:282-800(+)